MDHFTGIQSWGHYRYVDPVREYVEEVANDDVRATLAWLDEAGFRLTASQGGRRESFGNALLVFSADAEVKIVRDRGQWDISVSPAHGGSWFSLAVLTAARQGREWKAPAIDFSAGLPCQRQIDNRTYNALLRSLRCLGERGFALLVGRWRVLQYVTACPKKIGDLAKAALVLTQFEYRYLPR